MKYTEEAGGVWMWAERGTVGISAAAVLTAGGLIVAGTDPWIGSLTLHPVHHGLGEHLELILKLGEKILKVIIPGKEKFIYWNLK